MFESVENVFVSGNLFVCVLPWYYIVEGYDTVHVQSQIVVENDPAASD